jgi:hypothetical protein
MSHSVLDAFVRQLDLDVDRIGICSACLSFVAIPLSDGDERTAEREARQMTSILWEEGLAEPALSSVRRASAAGVAGARRGLVDLEQNGGRSVTARAIVLRLASDLGHRVEKEVRAAKAARCN